MYVQANLENYVFTRFGTPTGMIQGHSNHFHAKYIAIKSAWVHVRAPKVNWMAQTFGFLFDRKLSSLFLFTANKQ